MNDLHPLSRGIARAALALALGLAACGADDPATRDTMTTTDATTADTSPADTSDAASPDGDATLSLCDPAHAPVPPVGTNDTTYSLVTRTDCLDEACACDPEAAARVRERVEDLLACGAVSLGWFEPMGSTYMMVVGREAGACVIDIAHEVEGGVGIARCRLPLPVAPWAGLAGVVDRDGTSDPLDGIHDRCTTQAGCCVLDGCPNPCTGTEPLCPMGRFDACADTPR